MARLAFATFLFVTLSLVRFEPKERLYINRKQNRPKLYLRPLVFHEISVDSLVHQNVHIMCVKFTGVRWMHTNRKIVSTKDRGVVTSSLHTSLHSMQKVCLKPLRYKNYILRRYCPPTSYRALVI